MKKWEKPIIKILLLKDTEVIGYNIIANCNCTSTLSDLGYEPVECYLCHCCKEVIHNITEKDMQIHVKDCQLKGCKS